MPLKAKYFFSHDGGNRGEIDIPASGGSQDLSLSGVNFGHLLYPGDRESTQGAETVVRLGNDDPKEIYLSKAGDERSFEMHIPGKKVGEFTELDKLQIDIKRI